MKKDLTPGTIYAAAVAALPAGDIDHQASDLYLKRTPAAVRGFPIGGQDHMKRVWTTPLEKSMDNPTGAVFRPVP